MQYFIVIVFIQSLVVGTVTRACDTSIDPNKDVIFKLYTQNNPTAYQIIKTGDVPSLSNSNYNTSKKTVFYVTGWNANEFARSTVLIRDAAVAVNVNYILCDWYEKNKLSFPCPDENVYNVGTFTGNFINWLISRGTDLSKIVVVGDSLGAHVMGHIGRTITSGKIPYLVALDPTVINWGPTSPRVKVGDGAQLEVIHTSTNGPGIKEPIGDNDFYPNGGKTMPGCGPFLDFDCYHERATSYWAYSLNNSRFMAQQCNNYNEMTDGHCANLYQLHMGGLNAKTKKGVFYLKTGPNPPYYL